MPAFELRQSLAAGAPRRCSITMDACSFLATDVTLRRIGVTRN